MENLEPVPDHSTTYCRLPGGEQQNQTSRKPRLLHQPSHLPASLMRRKEETPCPRIPAQQCRRRTVPVAERRGFGRLISHKLSSPAHPQASGSSSGTLVPAQELRWHSRTISCDLLQSDRALSSSGTAMLELWDTNQKAGEHVPPVR